VTVTLDEALDQLNIEDASDVAEIQLYVDAANEWVDRRIGVAGWVASTEVNTIKLATLFLVDHLWESQRGPAATPLGGDEFVQVASRSFAVPNRVIDLLRDPSRNAAAAHAFPDACAWPDPAEWPAP
jgi:hypothetical protein